MGQEDWDAPRSSRQGCVDGGAGAVKREQEFAGAPLVPRPGGEAPAGADGGHHSARRDSPRAEARHSPMDD